MEEGGPWLRACGVAALAGRPIVPVTVAGRQLVIVSDGRGLVAAERACPHEGADLARGWCAAGRLFCPRHRAWFDLASGAVSPGWHFRALALHRARIVGDEVSVSLA